MDLNLRKARKLESKIQKHLAAAQLKGSVDVRIKGTLESALDEVSKGGKKLSEDLTNLLKLNEIRFDIRNQIANANQGVGINALMTQREMLKAKSEVLTKLMSVEIAPSKEQLGDLLEGKQKQLDKGGDSYGRLLVTVDVPVVGETERATINDQISSTIKELEDVEDQLAQKNLGAKISLSADAATLLKSQGLL